MKISTFPLPSTPCARARKNHDEHHGGGDRRNEAQRAHPDLRPPGKSNPAHRQINIHPRFDRQGPERAVELTLERQRLEHPRQRPPHAANDRRCLAHVFPRRRRLQIVLDRQGGQRGGEDEHGERHHEPDRRKEPEPASPQEMGEVAPIEQARRHEETARHEQHVERHLGDLSPDIVVSKVAPVDAKGGPAVGKHNGEGREQPQQREIVVAAPRVFGKAHQAPTLWSGLRAVGVTRPPEPAARAPPAAAPSEDRRP